MAVPLYLATGPELGEKSDWTNTLKTRAQKQFGELETFNFYATETPFAEVLSLLMNGSLFAQARFISVQNAEHIKNKDDIALLKDWLSSADGSSILVLLSDDISVDKKLDALVPKENKKVFWELFQDKKEQWVKNLFRQNGLGITDSAVDAILELVENNTGALRTECSRFFVCFEKGYAVTEDDVEKILAHNREESAFTLFDALCANCSQEERLANGLEIIQKIRLSKDSSSVAIIAGLTYCFRKLKTWHNLVEVGAPSQLDLKIKGFASKKAQEQNRRASRIWSFEDCSRILALLASTDMQVRSGGTAQEETLLHLLLYSIVRKKGAKLAEYRPD